MGLTRTVYTVRFRCVTKSAESPDSPVRILRKERGLTQEQLAGEVGCDQTTISDVEVGRLRPSLRLARSIASALGSTLDDLFGEAVAS